MNLFDRLLLLSKASFIGRKSIEILPPDWEKTGDGMECHIDHEENFPNNEKLFSETAIPGPF